MNEYRKFIFFLQFRARCVVWLRTHAHAFYWRFMKYKYASCNCGFLTIECLSQTSKVESICTKKQLINNAYATTLRISYAREIARSAKFPVAPKRRFN